MPEADLFNLPFIFSDLDHFYRGVDGPVGESVASKVETSLDSEFLGWWFSGIRNAWSGERPIRTPDDLQGLKNRVMGSQVLIDTFNALGAQATPMSFGEVYTSLQQGVIDRAETNHEALLDIVPRDDRLVVEAKVNPADIDIVHPGLAAHVRLTAFNSRSGRPVNGKVTSVSADSIMDDRTGEAYYPVRVELTGDISEALEGSALYPGMPAEVMFVNAARTPLDYAKRPVIRS